MKFPDFSLTFRVEASKDYPESSVYRYGQESLFHINEKQGELGEGMGCSFPNRLGSLGERRKLPQHGPGCSPSRKTSFGAFRV